MRSQKNIIPDRLLFAVLVIIYCVSFLNVGESSAETLYIKKSGTKLQASESARSKVVTKLNGGTPVQVIKKSKRFYLVSAPGGEKGWVFKFKLTSKAPAGSDGGGGLLDALGGEQKIAAKESSSGSSIRGLSPISEEHAKNKGIPEESIQAVKEMEQFKVNPRELDQFLSEGHLGEYAE